MTNWPGPAKQDSPGKIETYDKAKYMDNFIPFTETIFLMKI